MCLDFIKMIYINFFCVIYLKFIYKPFHKSASFLLITKFFIINDHFLMIILIVNYYC